MWELDSKESWALKNWCFWTVVLEKTLESPLDSKEIQPVHPKGNQSWVFIGGTDVEAEISILWPPESKSWLIGKDPDAGKDWGQEEKGTTENKMIGWHHWLNGHGFGGTLGVGDGQGGLTCCGSWCRKRVRHDWVTELNWTVPAALNKRSNFPIFSTTLVIICLFDYTFLVSMKWYLIGVFVCISQKVNEAEHCFMCLLTILIRSLEIRLFRFFTHF